MKTILSVLVFSILVGCGGSNSDGSSALTYSSCKIISSNAMYLPDRDNDLRQCWNAFDEGYESQGDALQWCERQVNEYLSEDTYLLDQRLLMRLKVHIVPSYYLI